MSGRDTEALGEVVKSRMDLVVKHDGRLNLLCCLVDEGQLSVPQLAARIGESVQAVRYWASLLDTFGLVEELDPLDDGEPLYVATLDDQPEWVQEAIRQHRPRAL
jgi:hypothetical protein